MKLLFDENLSPHLISQLSDIYPDSTHVYHVSLDQSSDRDIWDYARLNDFMVVTRDADYSDLSVMSGYPPKVIWIRRGNCKTKDIEIILRLNKEAITMLAEDMNVGILILF